MTNWDKLLDLVDRTREKIFFFNGNRSYVIMSLEEYERVIEKNDKLVGLSETDTLDKVNRDIANWKAKSTEENADAMARVVAEEQAQVDDDEFHIEPVEV